MKSKKPYLMLFVTMCLTLASCFGAPAQLRSKNVEVAAIGGGTATSQTAIKRDQLAAEIRRFADRYSGRMSVESRLILEKAESPELRLFASAWNLGSRSASMEIAIGQNPVENLLDMLVFTTLTSIEVEGYFVPKYLEGELGAGLRRAAKQLNEEAWVLSNMVLTTEQQDDLRTLIANWKSENPDQHYFWHIRFSGFSGQRAKDLERVEQTGGLLAEVQKTRETAEEFQAFSERLLYYLQRAPAITRLEVTMGVMELLNTQEVIQLLEDAHRISGSTESYANFADQLFTETNATLELLFDKIRLEREASLIQFYGSLKKERTATIDYLADRQDKMIRELLQSKELSEALETIGDQGGRVVNITFERSVLLIVLWIVAYVSGKLIYDYVHYRIRMARRPI